MSKKVYSEEYAVEVNKGLEDGSSEFQYQIDVFDTLEEAEKFKKEYSEPLKENEYLNIICIEYNKNGDEIGFYSV